MLYLSGTTLNIQSLIGAIMAVGVAMANAILLVTFAENRRRAEKGDSPHLPERPGGGHHACMVGAQMGTVPLFFRPAAEAAVEGAGSRLRAILMTTCAMMAGMLPMALSFGESGQQNGPLGRAVIGGLAAATLATLFILPSVFTLVQSRATTRAASLDPGDPQSAHYVPHASSGTD